MINDNQINNNILSVINLLTESILVLEFDTGLIFELNRHAEQILGFTKSELLGKSIDDFTVFKTSKLTELISQSKSNNKLNISFKGKNDEIINLTIDYTKINDGLKSFAFCIIKLTNILGLKAIDDTTFDDILKKITHNSISSSAVLVDAQDKNLPIVYANEAFLKTTGYSRNEVIGKNCKFLQRDDINTDELKILRNAIKNKTGCKVILKNYTKNGELFWNELTISPNFNEDGVLTHFIGVQNDITKEIEKQNFINKQNEIIRQSNELANIGGWEIDLKTNNQICSPELIKIREDDSTNTIVSKEYSLQFYPEEIRNEIDEAINKLFNEEEEEQFDIEVPYITKKGNHKWVRSLGSSIINNQGERKIYGVLKDITKEKHQELILKKSAEELLQYKNALNQIAIVSICDRNRKIVHVNDLFCKISEFTREEIIGETHSLITIKPENENLVDKIWATILQGRIWKGEIQIKSKKDKQIWTYTTVVPILFINNEPTNFLFIRYDISKRKNQEFFIQKTLEEKEILLDEIHHRVKNNLQIVSSLMNIQKQYIENDSLKEMYIDMQNRILSISFIHDTIYQTKNYSFINANIYIGSIINNLQNAILNKNITIIYEVEKGIELGVSTATYCGIIINEAVSNAIKYAFVEPYNNPKIESKLVRLQDKKDSYLLTIIDNGKGLDFNPINEKRKKLGFELMSGLADQMDGSFNFENQNGLKITIEFTDNKKS